MIINKEENKLLVYKAKKGNTEMSEIPQDLVMQSTKENDDNVVIVHERCKKREENEDKIP